MYIPEIGDKIKLIEDWNFTLECENRNNDLAAYFGYHHFIGWINNEELPPMRPIDYADKINYPSWDNFKKKNLWGEYYDNDAYYEARRIAEQNCPEFIQWNKEFEEYTIKTKQLGKEKIEVILPKNIILKIDRIYIRKGAKDYSSVSFLASGLGDVKVQTMYYRNQKTINKKSLRFWVKLNQCNQIEFKKVN